MVKPARDFIWLGGRPALDLCNTVTGDGTELLAEPADVVHWLTEGGFGEPDCHPEATDLERIHALRGELRSAFVVHDPGAIAELVSDWLATTPGRLTIDRSTLRSSFCPEVSTCRCLLVPALLDALDLARDEITRVRECASETCSVVYLDSSRNRSRRWCSMEICGSRAKAHAYYARRRSGRDVEGDGSHADSSRSLADSGVAAERGEEACRADVQAAEDPVDPGTPGRRAQ